MKINKLVTIALAFALAVPVMTFAQNGTFTPYSNYAYGMLNDNATSTQRAMGGIGYAMNSGRQINVMNPASYAAIDSLTFLFDMGVTGTSQWRSTVENGSKISENNLGGGLDYITMQWPIMRKLGMSVGILPFSSVGYAFGSEIDNGVVARQGSGSINELYLGMGYSPFKGFNVGFNVAYLFGSTYNDVQTIATTLVNTLYERELQVRDWHLDLGLQYSMWLNPNNRVTLGLTYSPAKDLHGNVRTLQYIINSATASPDVETTEELPLKGRYSLPDTWGAGVNYELNGRWMFEADFTYQPWSKAKYYAIEGSDPTHELCDRWKVAIGSQFTPNPRGSYGQRINFRLGAYYNHDYLMVRGNNVREHGVTLGVGLPVPGFRSVMNVGLGWMHRQAYPTSLIKENYLNLTIGINFNEVWFRKARIY